MKIEKIKQEMLEYRDYYGGDLIDLSEIDRAKTKKQLAELIDSHVRHMEMMAIEATTNIENFRRKLGLNIL